MDSMERIPPSLSGVSSPRIPSRPGIPSRSGIGQPSRRLLPRLLNRQRPHFEVAYARAGQGDGVDAGVVAQVAAGQGEGPDAFGGRAGLCQGQDPNQDGDQGQSDEEGGSGGARG